MTGLEFGIARREVVDLVFAHVDIALLDVKHMDSKAHERLTGVPNNCILDNIRHIHGELGVPVILRMPTVPGYNGSIESLHAVGRFAASLGGDVSVNLLPYHRLGESKSESLGIEPSGSGDMEALKEIVVGHAGIKGKPPRKEVVFLCWVSRRRAEDSGHSPSDRQRNSRCRSGC